MIELKIKKELHTASGKILMDIDLDFPDKEVTAIMGPSGAGKTTLLRIIAGLTPVQSGTLKVNNEPWLDTAKGINLATRKRSIGMVFQDYALFPNMTVRENLEFALDKNQSKTLVEELMTIMDLEQLHQHRPTILSGGQEQRVALARALVRQPKVLLLDEPLSALDATMRHKLQDYLLKVQEKFPVTTIWVSHDERETLKMAKKIIHLDNGQVIKNSDAKGIAIASNSNSTTGIIERITAEWIEVKIGNSLLQIPTHKTTTLKPGQTVEISFDGLNPTLKTAI